MRCFKETVIGAVLSFTLLILWGDRPEAAEPKESLSEQEFIAGNVLLTLYHEAGHALISIFDLPIPGSEEDAADAFSVLALTEELKQGEMSEVRETKLDNYLFATALYWLVMSEDEEADPADQPGEHSLDSQRLLQHLCLVYGSDPEVYIDLPRDFAVEDRITSSCQQTYEQTIGGWENLLEPYLLGDLLAVDKLTVIEEAPDPQYQGYRAWLHVHGILDEFEGFIENSFNLPTKITLRLKSCGEANAFWDPQTLEIILCDEQVAEYSHVYEELQLAK
ncbi:DUF4344 domain-containing metallopeptidase [Kiloniella laminariae]|uniref:DUF4344 domain-containing metallopeptidase n=1 Tax=Kiloniella laminariae TaxID=454162 RepID=A0ABT4LLV3_9PROT|nr:DUF4344 domain-containing metallopeptidase [Kiloniella laminariae]MCZ4281356.1 DUF4344 domain-containing metallopeptidase [Kiloniella laminariae]